MKKLIGPTVVIMLCGTLLYWSIPHVIRSLIGYPIVSVQCDAAFAPALQKNIETSCKKLFVPLNSAWIQLIHEQFPLVGHITSTRENNVVLINVEHVPFVARVNDQYVIDTTGTIHVLKNITPETSAALKNITAQVSARELNEEFKQFIQHLPAAILEKYTIDWHSPYLIYLTPTPATYRLITRYDLITDIQKLAAAECLAQLPQHVKKKNTLDMRFNKQIVLNYQTPTKAFF